MGLKKITSSEMEYVAKFYGHHSAETIGLQLGRTEHAIRHIIAKLKRTGQFEYLQNIDGFYPKIEKPWKPPQSGYKGITWAAGRKWEARYRGIYVGRFKTVEEAKRAIEEFKQSKRA
jgi:hypothetical protein